MQHLATMTAREAARELGVHIRTVHRWIVAGILPASKAPGYRGPYLVDPAAVEAIKEGDDRD